jgi:hypothetical protein
MIPQLFELLKSAVTRIIDIQCRVARIETRLMVLAEKLNIDVKEKKDGTHNAVVGKEKTGDP